MKLFTHTTDPSIIFVEFNGILEGKHADISGRFIEEHTSSNYQLTIIFHFLPDSILTNKEYLERASAMAKKLEPFISTSIWVGLTGLKKLFYSTFIKISRSKVKRLQKNTLAEVESFLNISFETDFTCVQEVQ